MKEYHVTYFREDDTSDKGTLTRNAKETKVRIEKLAPGETFVFQVRYVFVLSVSCLYACLSACLLTCLAACLYVYLSV